MLENDYIVLFPQNVLATIINILNRYYLVLKRFGNSQI